MTDDARELERRLWASHPAAARMMSPLGRRLVFPRGIPFQAAEARGCEINATLGQLTDDAGDPMPLPVLEESLVGVDRKEAFLYAPIEGPPALRRAWGDRERRLAGDPSVPVSTPFVAHGISHSLSLAADLFADADTDVLVPVPCWENYELMFTMRTAARVVGYAPWRSGSFDVEPLREALASVRGKAVVILNFPSNPTGWWPDAEQARALVEVVLAHPGPLAIVIDDAYEGFVHEPGLHGRSLFWDVAERADPERHLVIKCDGATKQLIFFSSRVGFFTHTATGDAEDVLTNKLKALTRATVGVASGPALALVGKALQDPRTDAAFEERRAVVGGRYRALKRALADLDPKVVRTWPFNSAYFAFLELAPHLDADKVRKRLIEEFCTGTICFPDQRALRVAYCSIEEHRMGALVAAIRAATH